MLRSMDAVAVLPVSLTDLEARLPRVSEGEGHVMLAREDRRLRAEPLEDGTLLHLGLPFSANPRVLGARLVADLGPLAEACHGRKVYVFPDVATPERRTVLGVVSELGEGGEWVALPEARPDDPVAQAFAGGGLPGGMLEQAQAMLGGVPGGLDTGALEGAMKAVFQNPEALAAVQQMAGQLFGEGGPAGANPADLLSKAQGLAAKLSEEQPDLVGTIRRGLEGTDDAPDAVAGDEDGGDEG
ncbi:MAG: hypothetical protein AAF447_26110 [Myxococcota bacterium]